MLCPQHLSSHAPREIGFLLKGQTPTAGGSTERSHQALVQLHFPTAGLRGAPRTVLTDSLSQLRTHIQLNRSSIYCVYMVACCHSGWQESPVCHPYPILVSQWEQHLLSQGELPDSLGGFIYIQHVNKIIFFLEGLKTVDRSTSAYSSPKL